MFSKKNRPIDFVGRFFFEKINRPVGSAAAAASCLTEPSVFEKFTQNARFTAVKRAFCV
jgi:hypothetical protein